MTQLPEWAVLPTSDECLMESIQAGQNEALEELHARYAALLKALIMKALHNDSDAEDMLQEVFIEIWNRAASYDPQLGRPLSWISTLARRRSIDRLRKRDAYCRVEARFAEEMKICGEGWTHVHEELSHAERHEHLTRALATLPEAQRVVLQLAYREQMTQREIAKHTGIPLGTIKTRLELGLRKMAACLFGFEDLLGDCERDGRFV